MLVWAAGLMSGLAHSSEPPRPGLSPDAAREPARPGTRAGGIPAKHLVEREGVYYETNSRTPFTGEAVSCHKNGQPEYERTLEGREQTRALGKLPQERSTTSQRKLQGREMARACRVV